MNNTNSKLTYFDTLVTSQTLQLAKAVIPYIGKTGSFLAVYVKFIELQNAMKYANSPRLSSSVAANETSNLNNDNVGLFNELKNFLGDDMIETFEMITSLMEMMKDNPDAQEDMFSNYMDMFKEMM